MLYWFCKNGIESKIERCEAGFELLNSVLRGKGNSDW
jgi:hypothetical protein